MQIARSVWFTEALISFFLVVLVYDQAAYDDPRRFIGAEFGLFAIAFIATVLYGRPGWVLTVGVALAFTFALVISVGASSTCGDSDFICLSPGEVFALGLIVSGALYPGWALGAG